MIDVCLRIVDILWAKLTDWLIRSIERVSPILHVLPISSLFLVAGLGYFARSSDIGLRGLARHRCIYIISLA